MQLNPENRPLNVDGLTIETKIENAIKAAAIAAANDGVEILSNELKAANDHAEKLKSYFDAVCNPVDWKAPIEAVVKAEDLALTIEAINWYCATPCAVVPVSNVSMFLAGKLFIVRSGGYRNGPAGP